MNDIRSTVLTTADRWLFRVMLVVSIYYTMRGHNAPGGGFIGGLIASAAFMLHFLAGGQRFDRLAGVVAPETVIGAGLAIALATASAPLFVGGVLLESHIWRIDVPVVGDVKLVSSLFFDLGVYLVVVGVVLAVLVSLGIEGGAIASDDELKGDQP
jgi:multisubunit Na+/H+ antiporter MnhB subunit